MIILENILKLIFSIGLGYLFGSFLPGYFLPLWFKKVDIRKLGDGNPGVLNVKRSVGLFPAIITALYDVSKGFIPMIILRCIFNFPEFFVYLGGFSAVLGHKFPFYLGFKGGRGFATSLSLFIFLFVKLLVQNFSSVQIIQFFVFLVIYFLLLNIATHGVGDVFTITAFPIIAFFMWLNAKSYVEVLFLTILSVVITYEAIKNLLRDGFKFYTEKHTFWRILARPFALLFIPLYIFTSKFVVLLILGIILAIFSLLDILRILVRRIENFFQLEITKNFKIFREKEVGRVSSITNFLLGIFISFVLFEREIAFASLGFTSLGDMMAKWVGINLGRKKLFKNSDKTLEGSLGFLSMSFVVSFFLWFEGLLPLYIVLVGAIVSFIVEALPNVIDDNFSVPIISGVVMEFIKKYF
ncbi:MAG: glycerol-3-phosphate acyltransferase [Dictyoglomus thermophilum]|nr:glycerol-3-phosphate acyltransferase [Dictyoglomus thermophilum]MCX7720640.1 glycerol-3-phosphate acyltransferase [Dictyoglomus thermophilum]